MASTITATYLVWDEDGAGLLVGREDDLVEVGYAKVGDQDYFGKVDFQMNIEFAKALAEAILKQVSDIEKDPA
jgi:hypothetical protein